jgi:hypothetical protein
VVLRDTASLDELKSTLLLSFPGCAASARRMRVREKLSSKLTGVFRSGNTLRANCAPGSLKDFKVLVVEALETERGDLEKHQLLLYTARWHPLSRKLDPHVEMVLDADTRLQELQKMLSESTGAGVEAAPSTDSSLPDSSSSTPAIPAEFIGLEKPLPYQLSDLFALASLKFNMDWVVPSSTLSNGHVFRVRDGDLLVWCDQRENAVEQYRQHSEADDLVHAGQRGERAQPKELKIYSPAEQLEMQEALRQVAQFEEEERKRQHQQAQQ